jgi:peptidoglycan hydrolase-like protein with peptidoglycan-binding domain
MTAKPQMPLDGKFGKDWKVTSAYGYRVHPIEQRKKHHNGVDLWGPKPKIWNEAWHTGKVIAAGTSKLKNADGSLGGVGWFVDVRSKINGKFYVARYAHMVENSLQVKVGEIVKPGTRLGIMGNTGASAGRHLHFEICKGRVHRWTSDGSGFVDPLKFIKTVIAKWEIDQEVDKATPDTGEVQPAPVHEPVKKPQPFKAVKLGSKGKTVIAVQKKLSLKADGQFGPITEAAVKKFQKAKGKPESGIVDLETWELLTK